MGSQERRQRQRQEIRAKILEAARQLFVNKGFEAVTMRQIAQKIDYTATAIYFHFKDKEALLRELCEIDFGALQGALGKIAMIPSPIERFRKMGFAYVDFALAHPNQYRLMFMTPSLPVDHVQTTIQRGNPEQDAYAFLRATVAECIAGGHFSKELKDADLVAQVVWSGVHGIASLYLCKRNDPWFDWRPVKKTIQLMTDSMIRGLAVD